jgi:hypothetical protein
MLKALYGGDWYRNSSRSSTTGFSGVRRRMALAGIQSEKKSILGEKLTYDNLEPAKTPELN